MPVSAGAKVPSRTRGKRTRAKLVEAAQRVFERDGFLDARVADISSAAGVAHGSFYTYFDSKEEVFRELAQGVLDEVYATMDTTDDGTAAERIRASNRRYIDVYARHASVLGLIEQVGALDEFHELKKELRANFVGPVERSIKAMRSGPAQRREINPHIAAHALVGMIDSFAYSWFVLREPFIKEEALEALDLIWLRSLGLDEG